VRVLGLLEDGRELSVWELMRALGQAQSKVSNHLACLRWCGFVQTRREHRVVYYRVTDGRVLQVNRAGARAGWPITPSTSQLPVRSDRRLMRRTDALSIAGVGYWRSFVAPRCPRRSRPSAD